LVPGANISVSFHPEPVLTLTPQVLTMSKQHKAEAIPVKEIDALMRNAIQVVTQNFDESHLPSSIRAFLKPVSTATCQGMFATCVMFARAMCALTNGAMVRLWTQKASPMALLIFHVAPAQRGKSRLYQATELLFEVADDVLQSMAKDYARTQQTEGAAEVDVPVQTKSISIQSCTPTELFFRSSCDFPQVQASE